MAKNLKSKTNQLELINLEKKRKLLKKISVVY